MTSVNNLIRTQPESDSAFVHALAPSEIHQTTPAAFAGATDAHTSPKYSFISTERVLEALGQAGFVPVNAAQTRCRAERRLVARHAIRLRRRYETVQLRDTIPEILFINGHDGKTAIQFRLGLFRVACTNGLIVSHGEITVWRVPHRGELLDEVVKAALEQSELFSRLGEVVEQMERTRLEEPQRLQLASDALRLRFPDDRHMAVEPSRLLEARRPEDVGTDLWRTYNVIQEHLLKGGLARRSASNRLTRTRRITAIREDVRLNAGLWDLARALAV